ncbi:MAG: outer membrane protein assembly factor BamA [Opitutales bacterium]
MKTILRSQFEAVKPFLRGFLPAILVVFCLSGNLGGQTTPPEARIVGEIEIEFVEIANVTRDLVRVNTQLSPGMAYDEGLIDQDIRSLYRTGLFEYIEVKREFTNGEVNLLFLLRPKYRVDSIEFSGNESVSDRRLRREIDVAPTSALDERAIRLDSETIYQFYQKRGYSQAVVNYEITRDPETGLGRVVHEIEEGPRIKITEVRFRGNDSISTRRLRKEMETRKWNLFSWFTDRGRFKDDVFEDDIETLYDFYRENGFLDVEIPTDEILFEYPREDRMVLTIPIVEGRRYEVGAITIAGNELYTEEELREQLVLTTGEVFVPSELDRNTARLRDYYGQDGYLDTLVRTQRIPNLETGAIDIHHEIEEGGEVFVESIQVEGNTKTKSLVIIRELGLGPGDVFDSVRMQTSQRRLQNTRFFEEVNLQPVGTAVEGRRDLRVSVREARTGSLTFGAGFSSLERVVVFAEVSQSNFDLFNYRSRFQGAGQKFRFRVQVGSRSNEAVLAFEEPWLFHRELAFGFQLFRSQSEFLSRHYDELRTGFEVYFRKRLIELVEGRLSYGFEVVDIFNVDAGAPSVVREERGKRNVSKVGFSLLRDTRDSLLVPTRGNRVELISELAGGPFAGQTNYYRLEARASQFFPVFEPQTQVFSILGRIGNIQNFGASDRVPFFDRYHLGGPNSLRGFEFRDVGPKEDGEAIGGKLFAMFSAEYSLTIVEPIRFAVFYDGGFVNRAAGDFDLSGYNDNYGFGLRIFIMGAPLRLDYGIPITIDDHNDTGGKFYISFGTRF